MLLQKKHSLENVEYCCGFLGSVKILSVLCYLNSLCGFFFFSQESLSSTTLIKFTYLTQIQSEREKETDREERKLPPEVQNQSSYFLLSGVYFSGTLVSVPLNLHSKLLMLLHSRTVVSNQYVWLCVGVCLSLDGSNPAVFAQTCPTTISPSLPWT